MEIVNLEYLMNPNVKVLMEPCVMALGFFDGVHKGHRKLIETAKAIAKKDNLKFTVMTFFPHPSNIIPSSKKIDRYITPLPIKKQLFKEMGVETLIIVNFNTNFAKLSHQQFVEDYLVGFQCKHVVAGFDFTYGFKGKGNMEQLVIDSDGRFEVTTVQKLECQEEKISSTIIRELLNIGDVHRIPLYLGDCYSIKGIVTHGEKNTGDSLKINIDKNYLLPLMGLYKVKLLVDNQVIFARVMIPTENKGSLVINIDQHFMRMIQKHIKISVISRIVGETAKYRQII
ncbi:FAD synthetase family protein [Metabacillus endolithicus]|uniref:Riboflavin biosynthesis protein n=1 Tax=Metabacillus endolithicus TaxID=1535204 RepID=A0ABW5BZ55_9BACI|nr:FAD synthetase family protein [Metabacillus endolithicus]UPG62466.1 FAD synthetase family protein [Metabacillus endolithicus]